MGWVSAEKDRGAVVAATNAGMMDARGDQVIDPIYFTDEYPREGCRLEIEVNADRCALQVRAPNGRMLESYLPPRGEVGRYVQEWVDGIVPRVKPLDRYRDQRSPGKSG